MEKTLGDTERARYDAVKRVFGIEVEWRQRLQSEPLREIIANCEGAGVTRAKHSSDKYERVKGRACTAERGGFDEEEILRKAVESKAAAKKEKGYRQVRLK